MLVTVAVVVMPGLYREVYGRYGYNSGLHGSAGRVVYGRRSYNSGPLA